MSHIFYSILKYRRATYPQYSGIDYCYNNDFQRKDNIYIANMPQNEGRNRNGYQRSP